MLPQDSIYLLVNPSREPLAASRDLRAIEAAARLLDMPVTRGRDGNLLHEIPIGVTSVRVPIP